MIIPLARRGSWEWWIANESVRSCGDRRLLSGIRLRRCGSLERVGEQYVTGVVLARTRCEKVCRHKIRMMAEAFGRLSFGEEHVEEVEVGC